MMQPPAATIVAVPATTSTVVATPVSAPVTVVGLDWAVLIPIIFAGLAMLITTTISTLKTFSNGRKNDAIHILVNSQASKMQADLAASQEEIRTLHQLIAALNARLNDPSHDA